VHPIPKRPDFSRPVPAGRLGEQLERFDHHGAHDVLVEKSLVEKLLTVGCDEQNVIQRCVARIFLLLAIKDDKNVP
jgi:hypothetical protein